MREIRCVIEIDAPAEQVWSVLADLTAYATWDPFIVEARGELRPGARLTLRLQPPGGRAIGFRAKVLNGEPGRELRWLGRTGAIGIFDGEHLHEVDRITHGTRYIQSEPFTGMLTSFAGGILQKTLRGFEAMNVALKEPAEIGVLSRLCPS